ncbi:hypothetical protein AeMF1_019030 [Aphanomyces euteiches]|nr:hypothetical protein AeMF1_019030 [Aphanomyces euteiches]KAH9192627.1 hypothetical protein AeNC1_005396 [Aphanomyces euteiches]
MSQPHMVWQLFQRVSFGLQWVQPPWRRRFFILRLSMACKDELWAAKATNAFLWLGMSTIVVYLPVYYDAYFDKLQIGVLSAIPCFCSLIAPPIWGAVADLLQRQRLVHVFCIVSSAAVMFMIQFASSDFVLTCILVLLANFQTSPTGPLLDQAIMVLVERVGGEYGKQRLFGAVGWGIGAFVTGLIVNAYGIAWSFRLQLAFVIPTLVVLSYIPAPDSRRSSSAAAPSVSFAEGMRQVTKKTDVLLLLLVVLLMGLMFGIVSSFLTLNLYELSGNSSWIVGIAIWLETLSELPAFFFADAVIKRLGIVKTIGISILGYAARITCYAFMTTAWMALPFELLHGVTFALSWAAFTKYIYDAAPPGTEGTMMGILSSVLNGLGRGTGTLVGGYLYNNFGAQVMWLTADMGVPLALLGLYLFARASPGAFSRHEVVRLNPVKDGV